MEALRDAIFAGNRAVGRLGLDVASGPGGTRRIRHAEAGALRMRFPNRSGSALDAVIVNVAGGMTGGDRFDVEIAIGDSAELSVTTAAAEKIYRSLGPDSEIAVKLSAGAGASLAWLPQETILFDQARLRRTIDIALGRNARLLLAEAAVFGRSAMGETVVSGFFADRWRVRAESKLVFAETMRLDGDIAQMLAEPAVAGNGVAVATVLKIPGDETMVAAARTAAAGGACDVGASAWNGLALIRLVAPDSAALRAELIRIIAAIGGGPLPRLWLN